MPVADVTHLSEIGRRRHGAARRADDRFADERGDRVRPDAGQGLVDILRARQLTDRVRCVERAAVAVALRRQRRVGRDVGLTRRAVSREGQRPGGRAVVAVPATQDRLAGRLAAGDPVASHDRDRQLGRFRAARGERHARMLRRARKSSRSADVRTPGSAACRTATDARTADAWRPRRLPRPRSARRGQSSPPRRRRTHPGIGRLCRRRCTPVRCARRRAGWIPLDTAGDQEMVSGLVTHAT